MQPVPENAATYIRQAGVDKWYFVGPNLYPGEFHMSLRPNSGNARMGHGWSSFCDYNDIGASDRLRFRFTNAVNRIVYIVRM